MTELVTDTSCALCGGATLPISKTCMSRRSSGLGWENDSTLQALGVEQAEVGIRFCAACLHAFRAPKFDTDILYTDSAYYVRKTTFESDRVGFVYGDRQNKPDWRRIFKGAQREFSRFAENAETICTNLGSGLRPGDAKLRILDWGGGNGATTNLYAHAIRLASGLDAEAYIYDPAHSTDGSNRLSRENIAAHAPYHIVNLSHVLEHTHDPVGMLRTACAYLAPSGLLIAEVPDERMNYARCAAGIRFGLHYHVAWFSRRSLERAMMKAGLRIVYADYSYESAYHGDPMSVIHGFGTRYSNGSIEARPPSSRIQELTSFALFFVRKVASRVGALAG